MNMRIALVSALIAITIGTAMAKLDRSTRLPANRVALALNAEVPVGCVDDDHDLVAVGALSRAGIKVAFGSCDLGTCGMFVHMRDFDQAPEVLKADARLHHYWIRMD